MGVNSRNTSRNMANAVKFSNWVQFDDEDKSDNFQIERSQPWPMKANDSSEAFNFSEYFSSIGSEISFESNCDKNSDDLRYSPLKEIQLKVLEEEKKDDEDIESSDSDCKYSVFSSLRESQAKGVYTGWSNQVLGECKEMGWSETLRIKL